MSDAQLYRLIFFYLYIFSLFIFNEINWYYYKYHFHSTFQCYSTFYHPLNRIHCTPAVQFYWNGTILHIRRPDWDEDNKCLHIKQYLIYSSTLFQINFLLIFYLLIIYVILLLLLCFNTLFIVFCIHVFVFNLLLISSNFQPIPFLDDYSSSCWNNVKRSCLIFPLSSLYFFY